MWSRSSLLLSMMALRASAWPKDIFASVAPAGSFTVPLDFIKMYLRSRHTPIMHLAAQLKTCPSSIGSLGRRRI